MITGTETCDDGDIGIPDCNDTCNGGACPTETNASGTTECGSCGNS
jgi:hypothetical protein